MKAKHVAPNKMVMLLPAWSVSEFLIRPGNQIVFGTRYVLPCGMKSPSNVRLPEVVNSLTLRNRKNPRVRSPSAYHKSPGGQSPQPRHLVKDDIGEWPSPGPEVCSVLRAFYAPDD